MLGPPSHQRARDDGADDGNDGQHEVGLAPAEGGDQLMRQGRPDQRSDADAGDGDAACRAATAYEPALHRRHARHVGKADAHADAEAVAEIDLPQAARLGGDDEARSDQQQAARYHGARPDAVGDQAGGQSQEEVEEGRDREDQRGFAAPGAEFSLDGAEERGEGIGDGVARHHAQEGADDDPPAGEYPALLDGEHGGNLGRDGPAGHGQ